MHQNNLFSGKVGWKFYLLSCQLFLTTKGYNDFGLLVIHLSIENLEASMKATVNKINALIYLVHGYRVSKEDKLSTSEQLKF